jgi:glycerol-3-phosphate dehydrogenase (NAD(P)+)
MNFGVIGSGSWATALVKVLADNGNKVNWWIRNPKTIQYIQNRRHNPQYLSSAYFDVSLLNIADDINEVVRASDVLVLAVPSAYIKEVLEQIETNLLKEKKDCISHKGDCSGC